jgi:hypothetical protein
MTYRAKPPHEIAGARREAIASGAKLIPVGHCHCCFWQVPKGALWCSTSCAQDYEKERAEFANG